MNRKNYGTLINQMLELQAEKLWDACTNSPGFHLSNVTVETLAENLKEAFNQRVTIEGKAMSDKLNALKSILWTSDDGEWVAIPTNRVPSGVKRSSNTLTLEHLLRIFKEGNHHYGKFNGPALDHRNDLPCIVRASDLRSPAPTKPEILWTSPDGEWVAIPSEQVPDKVTRTSNYTYLNILIEQWQCSDHKAYYGKYHGPNKSDIGYPCIVKAADLHVRPNVVTIPGKPTFPMPPMIDGLTHDRIREKYLQNMRADGTPKAQTYLSPAQKAWAREDWSSQLKEKVAESKEKERNRVICESQWGDDD